MATIHDVAKAASVSAKTVSRVMNGDAPVNVKTRAKIKKAMAELGYVPSNAARMMRSNKSGIVGLIIGTTSQSQDGMTATDVSELVIVKGVLAALEGCDKQMMIADTHGKSENVPGLVRSFLQYRVDGMLYVTPSRQRIESIQIHDGTPLVLVNCYDDVGTPAVLPDDRAGHRELLRGIVRSGHRRIGYLTQAEGQFVDDLRRAGYCDALKDAEIPFDPALVHATGSSDGNRTTEDAEAAISAMLALDEPPTALCCSNNTLALQVYNILRARGLDVPGQMSVAAYGDHLRMAEHVVPPLTTVEPPCRAIGAEAGRRLLTLLGEEPAQPEAPTLISGTIRWRKSVRPTDPTAPAADLSEE